MKRISQETKIQILEDLKNGIRPFEIQQKYNISKQTLYTIKKSGIDLIPEEEEEPTSQNAEQPEEQTNVPEREIAQSTIQMLDPENIKDFVSRPDENETSHQRIPKSLINEAQRQLKEQNKSKSQVT